MCRKAVARRHRKVLPMSTDLDDIIRRDDALYNMQGAREQAQIANGGKPQTLASRLDVLANAAGCEDAPAVVRETMTPHDPNTGEVQDGAQSESSADEGGSDLPEEIGDDGAPADAADSARNQLMNKLRKAAEKSSKALQLALAGLVPAQNEMVTAADRKYLEGLVADREREQAGAQS